MKDNITDINEKVGQWLINVGRSICKNYGHCKQKPRNKKM